MPAYIYYTVTDDYGSLSTVEVEFPITTPLSDLPLLLQAFADLINPLVEGGLEQAGIVVPVDITWAAAAVGSDVQEKAEFYFTTEGGFSKTLNLPAILEDYFLPNSKHIDLTDFDIAAFVSAIEDGIDLSGAGGSGTVQPCDQRGEDIIFLEKAIENWGKRRERPIYWPDDAFYSSKVLAIEPFSLAAYYTLNESGGAIAHDSSGNTFNGAATGVTWGQIGIGDGTTAAGFDGINDRIDFYSAGLRDFLDAGDGLSLSMWARISTWDQTQRVAINLKFLGLDNLLFYTNTTDSLVLQWRDDTGFHFNEFMPATNSWLHLGAIISKNANTAQFFYNGTPGSVKSIDTADWSDLEGAALGMNAALTIQFWRGDLAHVAIWRTVLAQSEMQVLAEV